MADPSRAYEMLEQLGSGSFGVVYKARERATNELVAIKHIDLDGTDDDIADIQQEISLLSTCSSRFVTRYKTSFVRGTKLWIVMEFLGGGSCLDLIKMQPMSEAHAAIICRELLLGLDYLHNSGKIHRDIKAANILLSHTGRVKIADFGVAAQLSNVKSQRNTFVGTPFWMAPEVIQELGYDFKADIWSLGITVMELVMGAPPNADLHPMKALFHIPKNPAPRLDATFSKDIRTFVAACLVKDPDSRPTARQLLQQRFIQRSGPVENLKSLIETAQMLEDDGDEKHVNFYQETLRDMSGAGANDDWVFDTIRPATAKAAMQTVRGRPQIQSEPEQRSIPQQAVVSQMSDVVMSGATVSRATVRHAPVRMNSTHSYIQPPQQISPSKRPSEPRSQENAPPPAPEPLLTMKRLSVSRQPLSLDMSFGNEQSNRHPFRRVSDDSPRHDIENAENSLPSHKIALTTSKDAKLGRRLFSKVIDPAFQELQAQTAGAKQKEAMANVVAAWSQLESTDAEGVLLAMKLMIEKLDNDLVLKKLLPQKSASGTERRLPHPTPNQTMDTTWDDQRPKLILAQNNPHLKSHKRRQSDQVPRPRNEFGDSPAFQNLQGYLSPHDPANAIGEGLYGRWLQGLKSRWPQM